MLDETDSGLDIDALKAVGAGINRIMRAPDKGVLLITHYQRLLDYVEPDRVHVLNAGRIVRSGGPELAKSSSAKAMRRRRHDVRSASSSSPERGGGPRREATWWRGPASSARSTVGPLHRPAAPAGPPPRAGEDLQ